MPNKIQYPVPVKVLRTAGMLNIAFKSFPVVIKPKSRCPIESTDVADVEPRFVEVDFLHAADPNRGQALRWLVPPPEWTAADLPDLKLESCKEDEAFLTLKNRRYKFNLQGGRARLEPVTKKAKA